MVNLYCVTCKHYTAMDYDSKNGRLMFFCTCAECGITKTKFVKKGN